MLSKFILREEDYTVYIYDFVSTEKFGFKRIPMFGIQDNHSGKTIFTTNGNMSVRTDTEPQKISGRQFPKTSYYQFNNEDSQAEFDITWKDEIEIRDMYGNSSKVAQAQFDAMGIQPQYIRYYPSGTLKLTKNGKTLTQSGNLIYEYNYLGKPDPRANV